MGTPEQGPNFDTGEQPNIALGNEPGFSDDTEGHVYKYEQAPGVIYQDEAPSVYYEDQAPGAVSDDQPGFSS